MKPRCNNGENKEKSFWDLPDRVMEFVDTSTFTYISVALLLVGVILGVVAKYV